MASLGKILERIPPVTRSILIINVIMFVATLIDQSLDRSFMVGTFALFFPTSPLFRWWQPVTHMFMHAGVWHILFNMYTLVMFGMIVERVLGTKKYLILFFVTGLGAAALHMGATWVEAYLNLAKLDHDLLLRLVELNFTPSMGASGAVYGILIAFAMLYPQAKLTLIFPPVTLDAKWMVTIFIGIELITGITGTQMGIAHFAHLGGALFGFLLVLYWRKSGKLWRR